MLFYCLVTILLLVDVITGHRKSGVCCVFLWLVVCKEKQTALSLNAKVAIKFQTINTEMESTEERWGVVKGGWFFFSPHQECVKNIVVQVFFPQSEKLLLTSKICRTSNANFSSVITTFKGSLLQFLKLYHLYALKELLIR